MREQQLQRFADQLEMALQEIVEQSSVQHRRRLLPEELIPDALHFLRTCLEGISEANYARKHPQIYARLVAAVHPEEALVPPLHPRLTSRSRQHTR